MTQYKRDNQWLRVAFSDGDKKYIEAPALTASAALGHSGPTSFPEMLIMYSDWKLALGVRSFREKPAPKHHLETAVLNQWQ